MQTDSGAVRIRPVGAPELAEVVRLCAAGMCDNPLHVRVFGADRAQRLLGLQRFFAVTSAYVQRHGLLYGAYRGGRLQGVFGLLGPGRCRPAPRDWLRLLAVFRASPSPLGTLALARWLLAWWRHDPPQPHWHLGPLVVVPELQGSGMAIHLIATVAAQLPASQPMAWLETDRLANVRLYSRSASSLRSLRYLLIRVAYLALIRKTSCPLYCSSPTNS